MTVVYGPADDTAEAKRLSRPLARCIFWLAAASYGAWYAAAAHSAESPAEPSSDLTVVTEPLLTSIEEEEERNGPFSRGLIELFVALGLAYQEYGEHDLAVTTLDHALYLMRFNEGLHSLDQAPLLERVAASQLAIGRRAEADGLRQRVLELARRNMDDPRSVPIFRDAAERQMELYERYLAGDVPPVFSVTAQGGSDASEYLPRFSVFRARRNYMEAIDASVRSGNRDHTQLAELEEGIARSYYLQASGLDRGGSLSLGGFLTEQRGTMYALGRASYGRRTEYIRGAAPTVLDHARALVEQADWALLFSHNGKAVDGYAEAYELLLQHGAAAPSIRELFPVDTPVLLPTFAASPFGTAGAAAASSYVDVDFEVSRYGEARRIRIVAVSGDAAAGVARRVASMIARGRFRPRPLAETAAAEYRLRYSLADRTLTPRS